MTQRILYWQRFYALLIDKMNAFQGNALRRHHFLHLARRDKHSDGGTPTLSCLLGL